MSERASEVASEHSTRSLARPFPSLADLALMSREKFYLVIVLTYADRPEDTKRNSTVMEWIGLD